MSVEIGSTSCILIGMADRINRSVFDSIQRLSKEQSSISNSEIARKLGIARTTVHKWRYQEYPDTNQTQTNTTKTNERIPKIVLSVFEEHKLQRENSQLKARIKTILDGRVLTDKLTEFSATLSENPIKIPTWHTRSKSVNKDAATACAFASDWHLDEIVYRSQVNGCNEFNRAIAETRCGQFFDNTAQLAKKYISGVQYDGLYFFLGGDMFSGNIHEELKETNECTIIESILHWTPVLVSGIRYLADKFNHVHIPCVVGNHGRNTRKPTAKNRCQDNFDWLFYHMLAMQLKDDPRITWDISPAADCLVKVHDTSFLFTHGDQFRGGTGISGLLAPLMLGDARKRKRQTAIGRSYEWMVYGHWHSLVLGVRGLLGNGSLKGYDEYAFVSNFDYEPPQQAFWLVQPRVGVTGRWPVHVLGDSEKY